MLKVEDLKREIIKESKIEKDFLPAVRKAKRQVQVLTDKAAAYLKQAKDLDTQIVNLDKEVRAGLAIGGDQEVDKAITRRSVLQEKKAAFEALGIEVDDVMLPAAQHTLDNATRKLFEALQLAVSLRHNVLQDELNSRLTGIEADVKKWTEAVYSLHDELVPTSVLFSAATIALKNGTIRNALGF